MSKLQVKWDRVADRQGLGSIGVDVSVDLLAMLAHTTMWQVSDDLGMEVRSRAVGFEPPRVRTRTLPTKI